MLQLVRGEQTEPPHPGSLLAFTGPVRGLRVLVAGASGPELVCRLLRAGCTSATNLRKIDRLMERDIDIIFAHIDTAALAGTLAQQAKRALCPAGRIIVGIDGASRAEIEGMLTRALKLAGFSNLRMRPCSDGVLIRGDLPMVGGRVVAGPVKRTA